MLYKVGDWVKCDGAGLWQIYRVFAYKFINPMTGEPQDKVTVFLKRFVSNTYKKSFKEACFDPALLLQLNTAEQVELDVFISQNPKLYQQYLAYEPKNIDSIYNVAVEVPASVDVAVLKKALTKLPPISDLKINQQLKEMGYNTQPLIPTWTVQFVSENFQLENGHLMFKFSKMIKY